MSDSLFPLRTWALFDLRLSLVWPSGSWLGWTAPPEEPSLIILSARGAGRHFISLLISLKGWDVEINFNQSQTESLLIATAGVTAAEMYQLQFNDEETATPSDAETSGWLINYLIDTELLLKSPIKQNCQKKCYFFLPKCEGLLLFSVSYHYNMNILDFQTADPIK